MTTILTILTLALLAFYVVGAVSLLIENVLTDFFEYFVEYNGYVVTTLAAINPAAITLLLLIGTVTSIQATILTVYCIIAIAFIAATVYLFFKDKGKL